MLLPLWTPAGAPARRDLQASLCVYAPTFNRSSGHAQWSYVQTAPKSPRGRAVDLDMFGFARLTALLSNGPGWMLRAFASAPAIISGRLPFGMFCVCNLRRGCYAPSRRTRPSQCVLTRESGACGVRFTAAERLRNSLGNVLTFHHDPEGQSIYPSSFPGTLPPIKPCKSICVEDPPKPELPANLPGFRARIIPGTAVGAGAPAGFPSLRTLAHTPRLYPVGTHESVCKRGRSPCLRVCSYAPASVIVVSP